MSRADEIAQGLRDETGALTFPLDVLDYNQGFEDFANGTPPPRITSASYDLGRARAREKAETRAEIMTELKAEDDRRDAVIRDLLKDRPDVLADYERKMAEVRSKSNG